MRAMSDHTRMNPSRRIDRLRTFNQRLQTTPESVKVLTDWNMKLEEKLVEVQGRVIGPQKIVFNSNRYIFSNPILEVSLTLSKCSFFFLLYRVSAGDQADWTRYFRDQRMLTTPRDGLDRWAIIAPKRNERDMRTLLQNLSRAAGGMGFQLGRPREYVELKLVLSITVFDLS